FIPPTRLCPPRDRMARRSVVTSRRLAGAGSAVQRPWLKAFLLPLGAPRSVFAQSAVSNPFRNVETPGGADRAKSEDQPHAKQIAHASQRYRARTRSRCRCRSPA